ncbi:MAG: glycosyltransferase family 2 protein, partial [Prevotellaceae bacterium]|nr:glycosyltransferase family 2 protein [Prevotellaceae bacterium]
MPKISVIVPNYNHALYLPQRIESILQQTCQDFELILLDDCSTDNSREIIEQYGNHPKVSHVIFNEKNSSSPFAQWNRGIEMAKGEYVWIAESDDWADVDFLQVLTEQMDRHPNVVLAYTLARYMNQKGTSELWSLEETGSITSFEGIQFIRNYLLFANVVYNVSMTLFRR